MKMIKLSAGEVVIRPLKWKEKKQCVQMAETSNGNIKMSVFLEQAEYIMADKDKAWIDDLTEQDGELLRAAVQEVLNSKGDAAKK